MQEKKEVDSLCPRKARIKPFNLSAKILKKHHVFQINGNTLSPELLHRPHRKTEHLHLVVSARARSGVVVFGLVVIVVGSLGGGSARRTGLVDQRRSGGIIVQRGKIVRR